MIVDPNKFSKCRLLVIGDLMIDEYLWGEVDRISPEAPVQVVSVEREDFTLGGSGNVANNLITLGAQVWAAGITGAGGNGRLLLDKFKQLGINTDGVIQDPGRPTTKKTRIIAANQHVLRIDRETRHEISDPINRKLIESIENTIPKIQVILISDYGKGVVTKSLVRRVVDIAKKQNKIIIVDPKGLDFRKYEGVSIITPNKKEASLAAGMDIFNDQDINVAGRALKKALGVNSILITCGKDGMVLIEKDRDPYKITARARQVFDVSGAGDTVVAMMGLALASGAKVREAVSIANTAAGIVVGKVGTATITRQELIESSKPTSGKSVLKQKNMAEIGLLSADLRKKGKKIVLTNGCFDLLHAGHIMFFSEARQLGDILIVALDDDESVKRIKGKGRPVIGSKDRVQIISALDVVDYVVTFSTESLNQLIETIQPDYLAKGSNYSKDEVIGRETAEKFGGRVSLIPISEDVSSTQIINNIKKIESK